MGPLTGIRVVEIGGIGPGPFAAMMLADMGADILRLGRPGQQNLLKSEGSDVVNRNRPSIAVDLKNADAKELVLRLAASADALIEGFRPGVMERLGLGPQEVLARNPRLVYGRITGYGQDGPFAMAAGHDINYISIAGALGAIAREGERPLFPLNLLGDYGGGGMLLAFGVLCGLLEARSSGRGQVIDASMVDGVALLTTVIHGLRSDGAWNAVPGTNPLDSGAHFYEVYATADGGHVAVGAIEPQFYADLLRVLEIDPADAPQWERARWPELKERLGAVFRTRSRDDWAALFEGTDACVTPVLSLDEAPSHPHSAARGTFMDAGGVVQPAPAPRFSRTPAGGDRHQRGADEALARWGVTADDVAGLRASDAIS
jgi:alpha-methylacyl-CoA racemase